MDHRHGRPAKCSTCGLGFLTSKGRVTYCSRACRREAYHPDSLTLAKVKDLAASGLSQADIGRHLGITRQRVHTLLKGQ